MALGPIKIEIFEAYSYSGGMPYIVEAKCEGLIDTLSSENVRVDYKVTNHDLGLAYSMPLQINGIVSEYDPILATADAIMSYSNNGVTGLNDDWISSDQIDLLNLAGRGPSSDFDSSAIVNAYGNENFIILAENGNNQTTRGRVELFALTGASTGTPFSEYQQIVSGQREAWISYNVGTGVNSKEAFGYSISLLTSLSGISGITFHTELYPGLSMEYSGVTRTGFCSNLALLIGSTGSCQSAPVLEDDEPTEVCLPSGLSSGALRQAINQFIEASVKRFTEGASVIPPTSNEFTEGGVALSYKVYEGIINYGTPYSGDTFCFNSYNFPEGYTGKYSGIYNAAPPYHDFRRCWTYPNHWNNIDQFVDLLNNWLSGLNHRLWHNFSNCFDLGRSGYYELGPLLKARKLNDTQIHIEATRINEAGNYSFTINKVARPPQKTPENVLKYMLPNTVKLQGADTFGSWTTLDTRTNINWNSLTPIKTVQTIVPSITGYSGVQTTIPPQYVVSATGSINRSLVYSAVISGTDKCGKTYSEDIHFYEVPSGLSRSCGETEGNDQLIGIVGDVIESGTSQNPIVRTNIVKTGWKFSNAGSWDYYRLVLSDFKSESKTANQALSNEFAVVNINLYGLAKGVNFQSGTACLVGANYSGHVTGITTGIITGLATGLATLANNGVVTLTNALVTGRPGLLGAVRFRNVFGFWTGPFTGILNTTITGTGFFNESVAGFYYDSGVTGISFSKQVSGLISGSGNLTGGPYNLVHDDYINALTATQTVSGYGTGIFSGIIPNFSGVVTQINAFALMSGTINQLAVSGSAIVNSGLLSSPSVVYHPSPTGTIQAQGTLSVNTPINNDRIFINEIPIYFHTSTLLGPLTYFKNVAELVNIINSGSGQFLTTGFSIGNKVYLTSLLLGDSGNSLKTSVSGTGVNFRPAFEAATLTGGQTFYQPLTGDGVFSGTLFRNVGKTGFFSGQGSGTLTGEIRNFSFVREFTGVWNLTTGDVDFRDKRFYSGSRITYDHSGVNFPVSPSSFDISVSYTNTPIVISNDLVRLKITGTNFATGITMLLSGKL